MTRMRLMTACLFLLGTIGGCASSDSTTASDAPKQADGSVALGASSTKDEDGDEAVTLEQCPDAVQATIKAHLDGGTIKEIERTTDHGEVLYEVDVMGGGGVVEFDVAADGAFRGFETDDEDDAHEMGIVDDESDNGGDDDEQAIALADVPDAVKSAAIAAVPGLVLESASRETEDGAVVFELDGKANGQSYEVEVSADGKVVEIETGGDDGDDDGHGG